MERSVGTIIALKSLGYVGGACLTRCRCDELPCPLLTWLHAELCARCPELRTDSKTAHDVVLVGELRNLLSNLSSPLSALTKDVLEASSLNKVAEFLVSELQAAHIVEQKGLHPVAAAEEGEKEQRVEDVGCDVAEFECNDDSDQRKSEMQAEWILLLHALNMDTSSSFEDVIDEVKSRLASLPGGEMTEPLLNTGLSREQWEKAKHMNRMLSTDYHCRREMMVKRFQVTLESFAWGDKQKERSAALASVPPLASLVSSSKVSPALLLAARADQSSIDPIKAGKSTAVYKTLMGSVPDRGGRPGEIEPPMPQWEQRRAKGNKSARGGREHRHKYSDKKKKGKRE